MTKFFHMYLCSSVGVLMVLTILFASYFERYSVFGNDKMTNGDFTEGLLAWKTSRHGIFQLNDSENGVKLAAPDGTRRLYISQTVTLKKMHLVKLSGLFKTTDVIAGNRRWKAARLAAVQNRVFPYGHQTDRTVISTQSGTTNWKEISGVVEVWSNTESIDVVFELIRAKGSASIRNISLVEVTENQSFLLLRTCLRFAWALILFSVLWKGIPEFRDAQRQGLVIGVAILILTGILLTADSKNALGGQLSYWLTGDFEGQNRLFGIWYTPSELAFTAGHFLGFWILSLTVLFHTRTMRTSIIMCLYLLLFAACTEIVQLLTENRNASFLDGITDTLGILAGWLVWKIARFQIGTKK